MRTMHYNWKTQWHAGLRTYGNTLQPIVSVSAMQPTRLWSECPLCSCYRPACCCLCHFNTSSYGMSPPKMSSALPTVTLMLPRPASLTNSKSSCNINRMSMLKAFDKVVSGCHKRSEAIWSQHDRNNSSNRKRTIVPTPPAYVVGMVI